LIPSRGDQIGLELTYHAPTESSRGAVRTREVNLRYPACSF
jgi:hypothetical protein